LFEQLPYQYIRPLGRAGVACGTKADRLAEIAQRGLPVPETYVLTPRAFALVLAHNEYPDATAISPGITLPDGLVEEIARIRADRFGGCQLVVRSSSSSEDSPFASCAGQYESFINLGSLDAVLTAVVRCYESLASPDVRAYLRLHGRDQGGETMSVLIQRMVRPEQAGVLFTRHPHGPEQMLAEYVDGLGTPVVSGTAPTKRLRLDRAGAPQEGLARSLLDTGHALEELFGRPQDVEWGWRDGILHVFQSRDISHPPQERITLARPVEFRTMLTGEPMSLGVGIGPVVPLADAASAPDGYLLAVDGAPAGPVVDAVARSSAVLVRNSGTLSHLATVLRELGKPALAVDRLPDPADGTVYAVDADSGLIGMLAEQDTVVRKQLVYEAFRSAARARGARIRYVGKIEAVSLDGDAVRSVHRALGGARNATFIGIQQIYPFDMPERVYCGISARIQQTGASVRVQVKRVVPDRTCAGHRHDEEILLPVESVAAARTLLCSLGYLELDRQERAIELYHHRGGKFQFNYWPGAGGTYLGIEAPDPAALEQALADLPVDPGRFVAIDGINIFEHFCLDRSFVHFGTGPVGLELDG
jgi:pyruvate,water dikinase